MSDELFSALLSGSGLRVVVALTTLVSREARRLHSAEAGSAALLAETLTGVSLLAALQKEKARVSLQLECDGPVRGLFVDADGGSLRGYVKKPGLAVLGAEGAFHWRPLLGNHGYLSVVRDLGEGEFYRSSVELEAFELGRDLERYFAVSDQVETVARIRTVPAGGEVLGAVGGILVQKLPDGDGAALLETGRRLTPESLDCALLEANGFGPGPAPLALPGRRARRPDQAAPRVPVRMLARARAPGPAGARSGRARGPPREGRSSGSQRVSSARPATSFHGTSCGR